jgi:hypothetical protein
MKPADILKLNRPPVILIFGPSGTGKTALTSQASNGYCFDFDDGMRTAATLRDKFFDQRQGIEFDTYLDRDPKNPDAYHRAIMKLIQIRGQIQAKTWKHDAVVVDSMTGLSKAIMLKSMKDQVGDSLGEPERNHWGSMVNYMRSFMTQIRCLNCLVLITAHLQTIDDDKGQLMAMLPSSITRNHGAKDLPWCVDEMWYSQVVPAGGGKFDYVVSGSPIDKVTTCSRSSIGRVKHSEIGLVKLLENGVLKA